MEGLIHPDFTTVADRFGKLFDAPGRGGGALAVYQDGELVVDIWAGSADAAGTQPWQRDTMAMSFSSTKGVVSTVVHRLVDRGLLDYDDPVSKWWPVFEHGERRRISVRRLMSHQAGLHRIRGLVADADEMLDHERMIELVAMQRPSPLPGRAAGYHGLTYGWLVDGLVRRITGSSLRELVQVELAEPLGADGMYIGAPESEHHRVAELFPPWPERMSIERLTRIGARFGLTRGIVDALLVPGFDRVMFEPSMLRTEMPAANGVFTARSLAKMYAALGTDGSVDGIQVLTPRTLQRAGKVQRRDRDYVLGIPMRWRLGYHQAFTTGKRSPKAFGHFGFGGSGGFADPETGIGLGFVTNRLGSVTTPLADARLARIGGAVLAAGRQRMAS